MHCAVALPARFTRVGLVSLVGLVAAACSDPVRPVQLEPCPARDASSTLEVSGVYRYSSPIFALRGTITFVQEGERVAVVDTTYDNADDRRLVGEAPLEGNHAALTLVPQNGDPDYTAEVEVVFEQDAFCVRRFSDTNDDVGAEGSYRGVRIGAAPSDAGN